MVASHSLVCFERMSALRSHQVCTQIKWQCSTQKREAAKWKESEQKKKSSMKWEKIVWEIDNKNSDGCELCSDFGIAMKMDAIIILP